MLAFVTHSGNAAFLAALALLVLLLVLELATLALAGLGPFGFLDDLEFGQGGPVAGFLDWLGLGRVPVVFVATGFLTFFAVVGFLLQGLAGGVLGGPLPGWLAVPVALVLALHPTRWFGRLMARWLPTRQSSAVSADTFVGRAAVICQGTARPGLSAEARLTDEHGQTHYVRVVPSDDGDAFPEGTEVALVEQAGAVFRAVRLSDYLP